MVELSCKQESIKQQETNKFQISQVSLQEIL